MRKKQREVSEQAGFRRFVIAVLVAFLFGTLIRVSLSPTKIEKFVRSKIEESPIRENLVFASAEVSLADGAVPDLAVILNKVEWRLGGRCPDTVPIRARVVRVPVRFMSLFSGHVSAGRVKIDELTVDLDEIKRNCEPGGTKTAHKDPVKETSKEVSETTGSVSSGAEPVGAPAEVWSQDDQQRISKLVSGVSVSRAEIFFENRMKSVIVEDASAVWQSDTLAVSTSLKFPPATVFGENLPTFTINGTVKQFEMMAQIRADLSEGALEANAVFKPVILRGARELNADIGLSFSDLPLSVVTPLLSKSQIVTGAFRPKFMWLDCNAQIRGVFSRLFVENPITLSACGISGQVGRLSFAEATRLPNGRWKPFEVSAEKLDVARVLETFEIQGPSGVFANFGQITGQLKLDGADAAELSGSLKGAVIRFAGGEGTALQPLAIDRIDAKLADNRWNVTFGDFKPDGGTADLGLRATADRQGRSVDIDIDLKQLKLNSRVEKVVFTGPVSDITGTSNITLDLAETALKKLRASFSLQDMHGSELASKEIKLEAQLLKGKPVGDPEIELTAKSAVVEVLKSGNLFRLLQPAMLGWDGEVSEDGKLLVVSRVAVKGRFHDNGFHWNGTSANVGTAMTLNSKGSVFRDHAINAELEARFPLASRLKWNVAGTWMRPVFTNASPELGALFVKAGLPRETVTAQVPPRLLGIPKE